MSVALYNELADDDSQFKAITRKVNKNTNQPFKRFRLRLRGKVQFHLFLPGGTNRFLLTFFFFDKLF